MTERRGRIRGGTWLTVGGAWAILAMVSGSAAAQGAFDNGLRVFEGISVGAAERDEPARMTEGGVLSVDGASAMVVTLSGELKGRAERAGIIGVFLLPDLPAFDGLYRSRGVFLPVAEVTAAAGKDGAAHFVATSKRLDVGFPRYRIFFFNTTGTRAAVNLYVNPIRG